MNVREIVLKGAVGNLPFVGSFAKELLSQVIPNRQIERLTALFERLDERISRIEGFDATATLSEPLLTDLLEDGMHQAVRATSEERMAYNADLVANGLSAGKAKALEHKVLLRLLGEVNDAEVILLAARLQKNADGTRRSGASFRKRHAAVLNSPPPTSQEDLDSDAMRDSFNEHLVRLGLLSRRFRASKRGAPIELDERTGLPKNPTIELSRLGRLLLSKIGLATSGER